MTQTLDATLKAEKITWGVYRDDSRLTEVTTTAEDTQFKLDKNSVFEAFNIVLAQTEKLKNYLQMNALANSNATDDLWKIITELDNRLNTLALKVR
jgi:hypothetical protein